MTSFLPKKLQYYTILCVTYIDTRIGIYIETWLEDQKEARAIFILISYVIYPGLTFKLNFRRVLQLAYIHRLNKELEVPMYLQNTYLLQLHTTPTTTR